MANGTPKRIILFGKKENLKFSSTTSAAKYLDVNRNTIISYINNGKRLNGYCVDYLFTGAN